MAKAPVSIALVTHSIHIFSQTYGHVFEVPDPVDIHSTNAVARSNRCQPRSTPVMRKTVSFSTQHVPWNHALAACTWHIGHHGSLRAKGALNPNTTSTMPLGASRARRRRLATPSRT
eukprot:5759569-Prymnesium_polylepis.1